MDEQELSFDAKKLRIGDQSLIRDDQQLRIVGKKLILDEQKLQIDESKPMLGEQKLHIDEEKLILDGKKLRIDEQRGVSSPHNLLFDNHLRPNTLRQRVGADPVVRAGDQRIPGGLPHFRAVLLSLRVTLARRGCRVEVGDDP